MRWASRAERSTVYTKARLRHLPKPSSTCVQVGRWAGTRVLLYLVLQALLGALLVSLPVPKPDTGVGVLRELWRACPPSWGHTLFFVVQKCVVPTIATHFPMFCSPQRRSSLPFGRRRHRHRAGSWSFPVPLRHIVSPGTHQKNPLVPPHLPYAHASAERQWKEPPPLPRPAWKRCHSPMSSR